MKEIYSNVISIGEFLGIEAKSYKTDKKTGDDEYKTVSEMNLPDDRVYKIPQYQREIRWTKLQVSGLVSDLLSTEKYLGSILISTEDGKSYDVIDGQQRITVLIMLLNYICKKRKVGEFEICNFENGTYIHFFDMMDIDFNVDSDLIDAETKTTYKKDDVLDQTKRFKILWEGIKKQLKKTDPTTLDCLKDNILASSVNLIINEEDKGTISKKKCVHQYLDINNKSVALDNIDILKAYLFKDNFPLWTKEWVNIQEKIAYLRVKNIEYNVQNIFYQYFLCRVNEQLEWTLKGLSAKFLTANGYKSSTLSYSSRKHITDVIKDFAFYNRMMNELKAYLDFVIYLTDSQNITVEFDKYCKKADGSILVDLEKKNIFRICKTIVGQKEQVPKMLVMKYFLYVLNPNTASSGYYKIIYNVYYAGIMFSVLRDKKESNAFAGLVLRKDWDKSIADTAKEYYLSQYDKVWYRKKVTRLGYSLETGGQELPRHIFAIKQFWPKNEKEFVPSDPKKLNILISSTLDWTMEHFFVNKSKKIEFTYGKNNRPGVYYYPDSVVKDIISCPINYLVLNEDKNTKIGNGSIKEKINELNKYGEEIWGSSLVYDFFKEADNVFSSGKCPESFEDIETEEEVIELFESYFSKDFYDELEEYEKRVIGKKPR